MSAEASDTRDDTYVMGRTSEEYQRLRRQAQAWEGVTRRVLQHNDLQAGMRCLDVGCGPGEVMRVMGELNRAGLNRVSLVTTGDAGQAQ